MKIAILSFYSGHVERGVENWTYELSQRLSRNHEVVVFQNENEKKIHDYKVVTANISINWDKQNSRTTLIKRFFLDYWSRTVAKFTLKILPNLISGDFDVIIPTNGGWQTIIVRIITWVRRSKLIIVGHSGRGWDDRYNLWNFPDVFVSLTEANKLWAKNVNPFIKIVAIPNGVDLVKFSKKGEKLKLDLKKPVILCVGALIPSKRIELAIRATSAIKDASLLVVGRGEDEEKIRSLGVKLLGERFSLLNLPYEKMPQVYRSVDIFTLPSWESEAFALVYLEALACGLGIVGTDDKIRKEIVSDAGILINPQDINAYTKALVNGLSVSWENKAENQVKKFSWENITKQYEDLMEFKK